MALPKIELPLFETTLFSTGKKVKFRPFTVREEKILLIAQEANDIDQTLLAIRQIITNCVYDLDVETLPMFDMEYLMLQLRAKSVNNVITFSITDPDTQKPVEIELDIDTIELTVDKRHSKEIQVSEDMRLIMRYPRLDEVSLFKNYKGNEVNTLFDIMIACIDCVVDGDTVSRLEDFTKEEIKTFIESFPGTVINDLKTFFETIPVLRYEAKYVNADGNEKTMILEGMETFFI
jgi:hypothetical protein